MANYSKSNVHFVDQDATTIAGNIRIVGIKYIGNASGTLNIKGEASTNGEILWEEAGTTNVYNQVSIRDQKGIFITLTNGATVYIYTRIDR